MGFSVSAAAAILLMASLVALGMAMTAFGDYTGTVNRAHSSMVDVDLDKINTRIAIAEVNRTAGTIELVNEGTTVIDVRTVNVLLNGTDATGSIAAVSVDSFNDTSVWAPQQHLSVRMDAPLDDVPIKVVAGRGASAYG